MVASAAMGSTRPDAAPHTNAFPGLLPSLRSGTEIIAPSGIFCIAIPIDRARAPAMVRSVFPLSTPPKTTPTAIPSGMLCRATARIIFIERGRRERGPSGRLSSTCWWGMTVSSSNRKHIPAAKPVSTGQVLPIPSPTCSSAGCNSDQKLAATITPDAKPSIALFVRSVIPLRSMNTIDAPSAVPRKGIVSPIIVSIVFLYCGLAPLRHFVTPPLCESGGTLVTGGCDFCCEVIKNSVHSTACGNILALAATNVVKFSIILFFLFIFVSYCTHTLFGNVGALRVGL